MAHTVTPADRARPGTIRRYRREMREALQGYRDARRAFFGMDRTRVGRYQVAYSRETEAAAAEAFEARAHWQWTVRRVRNAEQIRDEMAAGLRDRNGRPVGEEQAA